MFSREKATKRVWQVFPALGTLFRCLMSTTRTLQVSCVQMHWGRSLEWNLERTLQYLGQAAREGSRVLVSPEATLTSYYFPSLVRLPEAKVHGAWDQTRKATREAGLWSI